MSAMIEVSAAQFQSAINRMPPHHIPAKEEDGSVLYYREGDNLLIGQLRVDGVWLVLESLIRT
jgi:hypothetical protein